MPVILYVVRCWLCGREGAYEPDYEGTQTCYCGATDLSHGWTWRNGRWVGVKRAVAADRSGE